MLLFWDLFGCELCWLPVPCFCCLAFVLNLCGLLGPCLTCLFLFAVAFTLGCLGDLCFWWVEWFVVFLTGLFLLLILICCFLCCYFGGFSFVVLLNFRFDGVLGLTCLLCWI